jgi:hypothetical protein
LTAKEQELSAAQSRLNELSAQVRQSSGATPGRNVRWREELGDVLDVVHQLTRDVAADYTAGQREAARVQRVTTLLGQLEGDVSAALDGFSDGFDSPRSPVNNRAALDRAAGHLESAGRTAEQLRAEVEAIRGDLAGERR